MSTERDDEPRLLDPYAGPPEDPPDDLEADAEHAKHFAHNSVRYSRPPPEVPEGFDRDDFERK
jgi:hypothetical protein